MKNHIKYIVLFSILFNFIWEMVQMPFYLNMPWNFRTTIICLAASLGDAVMILIIYFLVSFFQKDSFWIRKLKLKGVMFSIICGFVLSVLVEWIAVANNLWQYSNSMPLLPFGEIGITPVLQMLILPLIVFKLTEIIIYFRS